MKNFKDLFQMISYLQYPLMVIGLIYVYKPLFLGKENMFEDYNNALIFSGLAIGFSTLQDTTKTQNKISKRVWENPKWGKIFLIYITIMTFFFILIGIIGLYLSSENAIKQLSIGILVFGIGMIGLLKAALEMFEHHRLDKKVSVK